MRKRAYLYAAILFTINAYICWRLFGLEWSHRMDSIEGAYIGISRHILSSWRDLAWWPAWYGGIPFHNSYPPLLHVLTALAAAGFRVSPARAHHFVTALFYCAGPVFAYLLLGRLSRRGFESFCAALFYSVFSPVGLLVPKVAADMGHPLRPRRLGTLVAYGDGPHVAALALLPLAVYCIDLALEKRTPLYWGLASLSLIAVVYTNWLGAFALAALVFCYLAAGATRRDWVATAALGAATYLVAMPWIPPSLIRTIQFNAQTIGGDFTHATSAMLRAAPLALLALAALKYGMFRLRTPAYLQMLALFSALVSWIGLGSSWFGWNVVPQPERYHLEVDFGLTLTLVMCVAFALRHAPRRLPQLSICALFLFSAAQIYRAHYYARGTIYPVDITTTVEYRVAHWLDEHMSGSRVMVPGSIQFFLQDFTEAPQLGGGFEQGDPNYVDRFAQYQVLSGAGAGTNDVEISVLWLKALGVQAIEAGGPGTREHYHAFTNGAKFQGVLAEIWREGDDAIYRVPQRNNSLAHVMRRPHLVSRRPSNGVDVEQVKTYVDAIDDPALPEARFLWRTQHSAEILATAQPNHIVSVQTNFDPGWHASANGRPARTFADGLGFLVVEPGCNGECRIELVYDGGREMRVAKWLRGITILCWVIWIWSTRKQPFMAFWESRRA